MMYKRNIIQPTFEFSVDQHVYTGSEKVHAYPKYNRIKL